MALAVTALDKAAYPSDGGARVVLTGTFPTGTPIEVVTVVGGQDVPGHSGRPGERRAYSRDGLTLTTYLPLLAPGSYSLEVLAGVERVAAPDPLVIVQANFASGVFSLRGVFSPIYRVGPRNLDQVPR